MRIRVRELSFRDGGGGKESGTVVHEASLALGAYLVAHPSTVAGKRVLELGSGTGWLALRLAQLGADVTATVRGQRPESAAIPPPRGAPAAAACTLLPQDRPGANKIENKLFNPIF